MGSTEDDSMAVTPPRAEPSSSQAEPPSAKSMPPKKTRTTLILPTTDGAMVSVDEAVPRYAQPSAAQVEEGIPSSTADSSGLRFDPANPGLSPLTFERGLERFAKP